ncbi:thioesterase family protein [Halobacillus sp. Marseille-P3879]|uniref:acyl-CoA thioesterase n=1 Tax=Halobacillus sp. Marseille-P3879 TaxID=2045014 RepID=UPI000C7A3370|nr:thioesterase family protein [Halobacillus sp. Marseille-P3879]
MKHETVTNVRFCETDAAGHVNNTSYFIYLEEARGKFFQSILKDYQTFGRFIIASTHCDFVSQAYYNQELVISTWISKIGNKSFQFKHEIRVKDSDTLIAAAGAAIVYFNYNEQTSEPIPAEFRKLLEGQLVAS